MLPYITLVGPSASGKTSLARLLSTSLNYPMLSLDNYYDSTSPAEFVTREGTAYRTYERPNLYRGDKLAQDALKLPSAVLEGFLLFHYPEILALPSLRIYLDTNFATLKQRRIVRDKLGAQRSHTWLSIGETETQTYVFPQKNTPHTHILDATLPLDTLLSTALTLLNAHA